jgi:hypothetical protein
LDVADRARIDVEALGDRAEPAAHRPELFEQREGIPDAGAAQTIERERHDRLHLATPHRAP